MPIENVLASVAVKNLKQSAEWYEKVLGKPGARPMPEVTEWTFERGGCLQLYQLAERAGAGSFTLAVTDLDEQISRLEALGIATKNRTSSDKVKTVMITDPDGNHIALAQAIDPALAH